jgi:hypothetical protein
LVILKPWIRIGIQPKMLDPDPDEMNADPQPWRKELVADTLVAHLTPIRAEMDRILQDTAYLGTKYGRVNDTYLLVLAG